MSQLCRRSFYLHGKYGSAVVAGNFAHLEDLSVSSLADDFAKLEVSRSSPFSSSVDILLRNWHGFDAVRSSKQSKYISIDSSIYRLASKKPKTTLAERSHW